jgi:copper homeostasis protein CutC
MNQVAKECGGKTKITVHKASDYTTDLPETIRTLSQMGVNEVLTQGGQNGILSLSNCSVI